MDQLIPVINRLQDVFSTVGCQPIDLPQIAVIGSQSVGKSSVLENIVGRDFLPRGSNIVTRRPLILQLFNTSKSDDDDIKNSDDNDEDKMDIESDHSHNNDDSNKKFSGDTWGEFLHKGSKKYFDFNEIRKEIEIETDRVAPNKAICSTAINLKIYSPTILNLTLIDLPGITKVAVKNQDKNIEQITKNLAWSFINKPNCLILAVSSATEDLATSTALQLAKSVDPNGVRTLGVITKIDLMDEGVDALNMLNGNIIPLKLGYIGVINRSQKDINNKKRISDAHISEKMFFKTHQKYRSVAPQCGTSYLSYKLNKILINHIKKCLPKVRGAINYSINELEEEILAYGVENDDLNENKGALLLDLISSFSENFKNLVDGSGATIYLRSMSKSELKTDGEELFGGARISYIFNTEFKRKLYSIKTFDGLSDKFIITSMRNAKGIRSSLFIPELCFENLVKIQIEKLRKPCLECLDLVYDELKRMMLQSSTPSIKRFNKFNYALNECVNDILQKHLKPTISFINQSIDIELAYIKTNHPDFISMDDVFRQNQQQKEQQEAQQNNQNNGNNKNNEKKQKKQNIWICSKCTLENEIDKKLCAVCGAPREETQKQPQIQQKYRYQQQYHNKNNYLQNMHTRPTQRESMELLVIKQFIVSYFQIVKKNIADIIPKSIMFLLVNKSKQRLQPHLALSLYKKDQFESLLSESPHIAKKRKEKKDLLQILQKALNIINQVNDYRVNNDHL